ncbi:MAG: NAD-dependent epimerase [Desulfovibrio sp.]|nr:NAD-dependent epimerase [Desulfovibrio sp.]
MHVLVTGAAGFIGYHLAHRLLSRGHRVVGIDNCSPYYDVALKEARIAQLDALGGQWRFVRMDISDADAMANLFSKEDFSHVLHMAAQAGVRYSLVAPDAYVSANLVGFANLLECCRRNDIAHLVFASSSSVYGLNTAQPFATTQNVDHPASLYAATKKSNELMAHAYSHLFRFPCTGLRFFTVYGPWGRPDMAMHLFTDAILNDRPIDVFNEGRMRRDFTYIDDIVEGVARIMDMPAGPDPAFDADAPNPSSSSAPWRIYNIGNNRTVELNEFIDTLEKALGKKARRNLLPMQPGDVAATWADVDDLAAVTGFAPSTPLAVGIEKYVAWHLAYYK